MMYTNKQLLQLTLPLFAEQFLIVFVGVADTFMVSYAGEAAVSGVALVDTISFLITAVLGALCTGGAVVASQYLGSGDRQKVALTGRLLLGGALLIGLVILAGVELLGAPALRLIFGNVEADVMQVPATTSASWGSATRFWRCTALLPRSTAARATA